MDGCVSQGRRSRERAPSKGWRSHAHAREDVSILFSENLRRSFLRWPTLLTFMSLRSGRMGRETKAKGRGESQSWRGRRGGDGGEGSPSTVKWGSVPNSIWWNAKFGM